MLLCFYLKAKQVKCFLTKNKTKTKKTEIMKVELSNDEIRAILYTIERSDVKEIINKFTRNLEPNCLGLHSAVYKLNKIRTKLNEEKL